MRKKHQVQAFLLRSLVAWVRWRSSVHHVGVWELPRGFSRALLSFRSWCWHGPLFNFPKRFSAALDLKMIYTWHVPTGSWTLSQGARGLKQTSAVKVSETLVYMSPLFKQNQQLWCCYRSPGRVSDLVGSSLLDIRVGSLQKGHLHWMAQPEATL